MKNRSAKFINPLPFVQNLSRSKSFYQDILGLEIVQEFSNFIQFENGFALHEGTTLYRSIFGEQASRSNNNYGCDNLVLYFEVDDIVTFFKEIEAKINVIHPIIRQDGDQFVFRFYDPDGHIVEIGQAR